MSDMENHKKGRECVIQPAGEFQETPDGKEIRRNMEDEASKGAQIS